MKKIIKLTESDLVKVIQKVISEQNSTTGRPELKSEVIDGVRTFKISKKDSKNLSSIVNQTGESVFGKGKFDIIQSKSPDLLIIVNKESYKKLLADEGITVTVGENCSEMRYDPAKKQWIGKSKSKSASAFGKEYVISRDVFFQILYGVGGIGCDNQNPETDRHILKQYTPGYSRNSMLDKYGMEAISKFYANPTNENLSAVCGYLKPTSFYKINGFKGVGGKCQASIKGSSAYNQIESMVPKNEFVRVQVVS